MPYANLVSPERCVQNNQLAFLNTTSPTYLSSLITAASNAVRRYCVERVFTLENFTDYYTVGIKKKETPMLMLRQFPVKSISRVGLMIRALNVQNSGSTGLARANVSTTDLGLVLTAVNNAVTSVVNLYYGTYPTILQLANAIIAAGNGWSASVQSGVNGNFNNWASADLKPIQGAVSTFQGGTYLELPQDLAVLQTGPYGFDGDDSYEGTWGMNGPGWRLDPETGEMWFNCRRGALTLRVDYIAGFDQVPQDVQEATVMTAISIWSAGKIDPMIKSEGAEDYNYTLKDDVYPIPTAAMKMLNVYRDYARYSLR